ncbi:CRISPR-associated endonuclease Cas1 [Plantactinospora sp. B5E13]|uniref:CRISPR-associated endonuclease Cas1 n=1 Tax=Plantactinospora sp. B5E13 TaxID=3153758 RepID=UPI00325C7B3E
MTSPGPLFTAATSLTALTTAWEDMLVDDRADGTLTAGTRRFAIDAKTHLADLADRLATGAYRPQPLTPVTIPKDDGGSRQLAIPPVTDRIVEKALASVLAPIIDPLLGPAAYAYRPGLGVTDAVQQVARLRAEGLAWVAHADIDDCFPSINMSRLRRLLSATLTEPEVLTLIDLLLSRPVSGDTGPRPGRGLPQGAPLSPLLANLALRHIDDRVTAAGFPMVRYGDDFCVLAATRADAQEGLHLVEHAAAEIGMRLGADSSVMSFADGFCFLGEDFGPRYPPVLNDHRIVEPATRTVYVAKPGAAVRTEAGRLIVESPDDVELLDVPTGHVERLVLFGPVGLSAGARSWALSSGVEVILASRRGHYLGQLSSGSTRRVARLRAQLACADDSTRAIPFGRAAIEAKIRKQITLIQRFTRRDNHEDLAAAVDAMRRMLALLPDATTRDEVMGVEGAAARAYFTGLSAAVPEPLRFVGRSRRPPLDLVNAALSYGYTLLTGEAVAALAAAGLDPAIGLLHTDTDRRPSLALDLIEEFRPLVVDQAITTLARANQLRPEHARTEDGRAGILLTEAGRAAVIDAYERRMLHSTRGALPGFAGSLRRHLHRQAQRVAAYIDRGTPWAGLSWR